MACEELNPTGRPEEGIAVRWYLKVLAVVLVPCIAWLVLDWLSLCTWDPARAKVSRARSEMRTLATAIEAYKVDHGAFAAARPMIDDFGRRSDDEQRAVQEAGALGLRTVEWGQRGCCGVTTPVAYVSELPIDPFAPVRGLSFLYLADENGFILVSPGPDRDYDIGDPAKVYDSSIQQPSAYLLAGGPWTYDPTNGTISNGDVWRVKD